jgi:hypothetical protein
MKGFAQRLADAVAATGHNHDFARYPHDRSPCSMIRNSGTGFARGETRNALARRSCSILLFCQVRIIRSRIAV